MKETSMQPNSIRLFCLLILIECLSFPVIAQKQTPTSTQKSGHLQKGNALEEAKQYENAIKEFELAAKENPKSSQPYVHLGACYWYLKKLDKSILYLKKASALEPKKAVPHYLLGYMLQNQGNFKEAETEYKQAISLNVQSAVDTATLYQNLATVQLELKKYRDAVDSMNQAIKIHPREARLYSQLGRIYSEANQLDDAEKTYLHCIELGLREANLYNELGLVYKAIAEKLEQASSPDNQAITSNYRKAYTQYQEALKLDPDNKGVLANLRFLKLTHGDVLNDESEKQK
jgi:Flp pilus assembly protein TadD